jgi:hypothetical protein
MVGASLDDLAGLGSSFRSLAANVDTALSGLSPQSISDVLGGLASISPNLPQLLQGLVFSSAYGTSAGHLLVFVRLRSRPGDPATCVAGAGCTRKAVAISIPDVQLSGQAPTLDVGTAVGVDLAVGTDLTQGGDAFLDPSGSITVAVNASNPNLHATATQGALEGAVSGAVDVGGTIVIGLADPTPADGRVTLDDLAAAGLTATPSTTTAAPIVLTGTAPDGSPATLTIVLAGGSILGAMSGALVTSGASPATATSSSGSAPPTTGSSEADGAIAASESSSTSSGTTMTSATSTTSTTSATAGARTVSSASPDTTASAPDETVTSGSTASAADAPAAAPTTSTSTTGDSSAVGAPTAVRKRL